MAQQDGETDEGDNDRTTRTYCNGCGKDMWEYSEEAKADGWCLSCAPECYVGGTHVAALED